MLHTTCMPHAKLAKSVWPSQLAWCMIIAPPTLLIPRKCGAGAGLKIRQVAYARMSIHSQSRMYNEAFQIGIDGEVDLSNV